MTRRANLTLHSRRITPAEVAQLWFRRGMAYVNEIRKDHPDFPQTGPDGLFLLSQVEAWFDRFHGIKKPELTVINEDQEIIRAINGVR